MHTLNSTLPNCNHKKVTKLGAISKREYEVLQCSATLSGIKVLLLEKNLVG
jgi:hypothetical protein